ncbi:MAG: DUF4494 domain-containing protein [Crocinitomicaceae bacterium]|nr:DUF4494 domain-containing protein [Flavobacteriales bacterium]NQZ34137.1 DUF4494 domain-containing protein [Crocinitomicaceae bacterium]
MNNWFTVKVKYTKQLDNGALKRVSEPYLLAAMTFTDAEARIYEELGQIIRGEFNVVGISRTEIHDIFAYDDADVWYKCKVRYESMDADTEKAKKVNQNFLVSAESVKEAYERIQESLSTLMVDFEIPSIIVSPIVEIFPYTEELDKELSRRPAEEVKKVEEEEEDDAQKGKVVFSASGSGADDEDEDEEIEEEEESEIEDEFDGE